jgi:hypothetical protein
MIKLTPDQIKQIAAAIHNAADAKAEESGWISIEAELTLNNQEYLIVGDVNVDYNVTKKRYRDRDMMPDTNVDFRIARFHRLELQHLTDEDDVQRLNYEDFRGWV